MKIPPPFAPVANAAVREVLHVSVTRWLATAIICLVLGAPLAVHSPAPMDPEPTPPSPLEPAVPLQEWTTDAGVFSVIARALPGRLPPPDPRQRLPPCAAKMGEEAIGGVCWLRLDVRPPCPQEVGATAYEHGGKCYAFALHAARVPTAGELRPNTFADP